MATNNLQNVINNEGISQQDLANSSHVSVGYINKVCNKKVTPAPKTQSKIVNGLNTLAKKLQYSLNDIFPNT